MRIWQNKTTTEEEKMDIHDDHDKNFPIEKSGYQRIKGSSWGNQ